MLPSQQFSNGSFISHTPHVSLVRPTSGGSNLKCRTLTGKVSLSAWLLKTVESSFQYTFCLLIGTVNLNNNSANGLQTSHSSTSSAPVNGANSGVVHRTSSMNGQYLDTSPSGQYADQREYVNGGGSYSSSQVRRMANEPAGRFPTVGGD
jgi:hypothetical protein